MRHKKQNNIVCVLHIVCTLISHIHHIHVLIRRMLSSVSKFVSFLEFEMVYGEDRHRLAESSLV